MESDFSHVDREILAIRRPSSKLLWVYALRSLAGLFLAPIIFVPFFFKYHTLRYELDDEGVSARWGILFRREIYLTYKRIQDIHVRRNIVERWLGIGTVDIQTASGSASAELSIEGMKSYELLRDFLYRRMRGFKHEPTQVAAGEAPGGGHEEDAIQLLNGIREELDGVKRALAGR